MGLWVVTGVKVGDHQVGLERPLGQTVQLAGHPHCLHSTKLQGWAAMNQVPSGLAAEFGDRRQQRLAWVISSIRAGSSGGCSRVSSPAARSAKIWLMQYQKSIALIAQADILDDLLEYEMRILTGAVIAFVAVDQRAYRIHGY